ncbi:hypothetical protein Ae201684P_015929 [Aphanomyces euteiches]|uniref:Uncharacterized protein n=1 Tax=Aphanomyces euteiches TaxID=100861 RepID=A0A6G0W7M0_9STRA|nr:hypothetical protein Ae201684_018150 [Aphanomyces euteiches]KAH9074031.1 hypothetical protein Ae201684P_015929 [Aphanomyces euteiches]
MDLKNRVPCWPLLASLAVLEAAVVVAVAVEAAALLVAVIAVNLAAAALLVAVIAVNLAAAALLVAVIAVNLAAVVVIAVVIAVNLAAVVADAVGFRSAVLVVQSFQKVACLHTVLPVHLVALLALQLVLFSKTMVRMLRMLRMKATTSVVDGATGASNVNVKVAFLQLLLWMRDWLNLDAVTLSVLLRCSP